MITIDDTITDAALPDLTYRELLLLIANVDSNTTIRVNNETVRRIATMSVALLARIDEFSMNRNELRYSHMREVSHHFERPLNYYAPHTPHTPHLTHSHTPE